MEHALQVMQEVRLTHRLRQLTDGSRSGLRPGVTQWIEIIGYLLVRMRREQGPHHGAAQMARQDGFYAYLRFDMQRADGADVWLTALRGTESPLARCAEAACVIGSDVAGSGVGQGRAHSIGVRFRYEGDEL